MQENDPTKSAFYDRCPLFGDLGPIEEAIGDARPDISECLEVVDEVRNCLIIPFLPHAPSLPINYLTKDYSYFNGVPYPDPQIVEDRIGYPPALLKSLRLIYWRATDILMYLGLSGDTAAEKAATIDEDSAIAIALETNGVEFAEKQIIDSTILFRLLALKSAMAAISTSLTYKEPFNERSFSQECYKAALIYLHRVREIKVRKNETEAKENLIEDLFIKQNQIEKLIPLEKAKNEDSDIKRARKKAYWEKLGKEYEIRDHEYIRIAEIIIREKIKAQRKNSKFYQFPPKDGWQAEVFRGIAKGLKLGKYVKGHENVREFIKINQHFKKNKYPPGDNNIREIFKKNTKWKEIVHNIKLGRYSVEPQ